MTDKTPRDKPLTPQQEAFCRGVSEGVSQYQAFLDAYPAAQKWQRASVDVKASTLVAQAKIQVRLAEIRDRLETVSVLKTANVLAEIHKLAHSDVRGIMHPDGRIKKLHELDSATAASVASYEEDEKGTVKYKFWDKNAALEKAAKHLGLYERDNTQKVGPIAELLADIGRSAFPVVK